MTPDTGKDVLTPRRILCIEGACENNLHDVDVCLGPGIVAVVGISGSGKSSLVFNTLYHEARRRFLQTLSLGSPWMRLRPAEVRAIHGLAPAVAVAQDVVNRNPNSSLATATGLHPFLRLLYAAFATPVCRSCGRAVTVLRSEGRLKAVQHLLRTSRRSVDVVVPVAQQVEGSHASLLALLRRELGSDQIEVDGRAWTGKPLDPGRPHTVLAAVGRLDPAAPIPTIRATLANAEALGSATIALRNGDGSLVALSSEPRCFPCGRTVEMLRPADFRHPDERTAAYQPGGVTFSALLACSVDRAAEVVAGMPLPADADRVREEIARRLAAVRGVGLGYLTLDRVSPTLSRGEAQRVRLAQLLVNRVEDLIHVLDEPTIGLDPGQVDRLLAQLSRLKGPVIMVEHDRWAVAQADRVIELGPGAGAAGGTIVFDGTPAALWRRHTLSGDFFSGRQKPARFHDNRSTRPMLTVRRAWLRNLAGFTCRFPVGRLTVVTGPSGAGKTTLVRDVLGESLASGSPHGCAGVDGPALRPLVVDQSPIGRNPRSNPATYTGLADHLRTMFADRTGLPARVFSFNRPEGRCPTCQGIGDMEVTMQFLPSTWVRCEACDGRRFRDEALTATASLSPGGPPLSIAEVFELSVDDARALAWPPEAARILDALTDIGLGYLTLGQPSTTLSGGEAQRVKLARHLAMARSDHLLAIDEPTTGLHPADLTRLLAVLHRLTERGATVVAVEHQPDVVLSADWIIRLGPGGGPQGGRLRYEGRPTGDAVRPRKPAPRARPRSAPRSHTIIRVRGATANNLRNLSLDIQKKRVTALIGVSGSGKSSLLRDVIEAEASRRILESLSMYERQSIKEGPEPPVRSLDGLGPTLFLGPERRLANPRATVGSATEISGFLEVLLAFLGERPCPRCQGVQRRAGVTPTAPWTCDRCGAEGRPLESRHFSPATYEAACLECGGLGTTQQPRVERLIVRPEAPLCAGAMFSPGYFPGAYFSRPESQGFRIMRTLGRRYGFDPDATPWRAMTEVAREAFLFGDRRPMALASASTKGRRQVIWRGFFPIVAGWDSGGLYTDHVPCPGCGGQRLRPEFLAVGLAGQNRYRLHGAPLWEVERVLDRLVPPPNWGSSITAALETARLRLAFLRQVELGYLSLDRLASTLSAGEAQRVKLASFLAGGLTGLTVLLDEPSRGLHPKEVGQIAAALIALRKAGNTVILVDHDPEIVGRADEVIALGPGAGRLGGTIIGRGTPIDVAGADRAFPLAHRPRRAARGWMRIRCPTGNNLAGRDVTIPLGVLVGLCGVSGSGKSTLAVDTIGRALAPPRITTSVAYEPVRPAPHAGIDGAPEHTVVVDQARSGITSPGIFLGIMAKLRTAYAQSEAAAATGLGSADFAPGCDECGGKGLIRQDMGFLPSISRPCDACEGTGYTAEVRSLTVRGWSLPAAERLTLTEVASLWSDREAIARVLRRACELGLDYLVLRQPSWSLSGGEAQRLKLVKELAREVKEPTLFVLDEPTVGQHATDVVRLVSILDQLVDKGHTVLVIEHHPGLLACCDWLLEMGPGAGPDGGRIIAEGSPESVSRLSTPTAPYLRQRLA